MRLCPARIGAASPQSISSPTPSTQSPSFRLPGLMMSSAATAPHSSFVFHFLSSLLLTQTPILEKFSYSPSKDPD